jgi:hypothetical protein
MTIRTFKQLGQGFSAEPLTITASINDAVVYEGIIPTTDKPIPVDTETWTDIVGEQLFTWELDTAFSGTVDMSFTISGPGSLFLTTTLANYVQISEPESGIFINSGPDVFGFFYQKQMTDYLLGNPFTNIKINGEPQTTSPTPLSSGQCSWFIKEGGTFSATVNVGVGPLTPATPV